MAATAPVVAESIAAGGFNEIFEDRISTKDLSRAIDKFNDGTINMEMSVDELTEKLQIDPDVA